MTKHFLKVALIVLGTTIVGAAQTKLAGVEDPRIIVSPQRQLYNGIPVHVPLRVAVKNLSSDRWVHDIEIEVTNTSEKPIYYMHVPNGSRSEDTIKSGVELPPDVWPCCANEPQRKG